MFKGTNASAGIGIGKAAIIKENELVLRPEKVIDGDVGSRSGNKSRRERGRDHAGTPDAVK